MEIARFYVPGIAPFALATRYTGLRTPLALLAGEMKVRRCSSQSAAEQPKTKASQIDAPCRHEKTASQENRTTPRTSNQEI